MTHQPDELLRAETESEEAEKALEDVQIRVLEGDPDVTASELIQAEAAANEKRNFLGKVRDVVRRQREAAAERDRLSRVAALRTLVFDSGDVDVDEILDDFKALADAASAFVSKVESHNAGFRKILHELASLGVTDETGSSAERISIPYGGGGIRIGDFLFTPLSAGHLLSEVAERALRDAGIGGIMPDTPTLNRVYDEHVASSRGIDLGEYWGISDELRYEQSRISELRDAS